MKSIIRKLEKKRNEVNKNTVRRCLYLLHTHIFQIKQVKNFAFAYGIEKSTSKAIIYIIDLEKVTLRKKTLKAKSYEDAKKLVRNFIKNLTA